MKLVCYRVFGSAAELCFVVLQNEFHDLYVRPASDELLQVGGSVEPEFSIIAIFYLIAPRTKVQQKPGLQLIDKTSSISDHPLGFAAPGLT